VSLAFLKKVSAGIVQWWEWALVVITLELKLNRFALWNKAVMEIFNMEEELAQASAIYDLVVTFLVNYSFQIVGAILIFVVGIVVASKVSSWLFRFCQSKGLDVTLSKFIANVVKLLFILMVGIIALGNLGISVTPFVAAIGALSLGAGLALQGLLSNYGAGLNIILTRPFVVGDTVLVQGVSGIVQDITLSTTILVDEDDVRITIPNRHIVGEIIHNSGAMSLVETHFLVCTNSNIQDVIDDSLQAVLAIDGLGNDTRALFGVSQLTGLGIEITGRIWVPTAQYFYYKFAINQSVQDRLIQTGVELATPAQTIRLQQD
jgi:small conductance mechanosensitive channel